MSTYPGLESLPASFEMHYTCSLAIVLLIAPEYMMKLPAIPRMEKAKETYRPIPTNMSIPDAVVSKVATLYIFSPDMKAAKKDKNRSAVTNDWPCWKNRIVDTRINNAPTMRNRYPVNMIFPNPLSIR